jgi:tetratricopeptide (TPR) repeat protein
LLTPEYVPGLAAFIRLYAEALAKCLKKPALIVLDNYEQVPSDAALHEIVRELAGSLPPEIGLMILSRTQPPPAFARLRLHGDLAILKGEELNLTDEEAQTFARSRRQQSPKAIDAERLARMLKQSQGWIAGFMFLLGTHQEAGHGAYEAEEADGNQQLIFDYFTTEVFEHFSPTVRRGLVCSVLLPAMTIPHLTRLTGDAEVAAALAELQRRNCFVVQRGQDEPVYEYHALFRAFLLDRARSVFELSEWRRFQKCAGDLLAEAGQADSAAHLYKESEEWQALAVLLLRDAPAWLVAGRHRTLDQWIDTLPEAVRSEPWLLFWQGMAKSPLRPAEARDRFERAYWIFAKQDDAAGLYSSWSGLMETYLNEFDDFHPVDHWIEEFKRLRLRHPNYPSIDIELRTACAIATVMFRRPQEELVQAWSERALDLLDPVNHLELSILLGSFVANYAGWQGDSHKIRLIIERLDSYTHSETISPLAYILWRAVEGRGAFHAAFGDTDGYRQGASEALAMAERTGLHLWDVILYTMQGNCFLINGDIAGAEAVIEIIKNNLYKNNYKDRSFYHHLLSNAAGQRGQWQLAAEEARTAAAMAIAAGKPFPEANCRIDWARALFRLEQTDEARKHLNQAWEIARAMKSRLLEHLCLVTEASIAFRAHQEPLGLHRLAEALRLSRTMGGPLFDLGGPPLMIPLYNRALEAGIEVEHVQAMIRRYQLVPSDPATASDRWPWPVRIYTLGRFDILCDGQPLRSSRKAQNKPLELIKLLCALGGSAVHPSRVTDILWPEAIGDTAEQALSTTLHRLRTLLKHDQAIQLEDRHLSLDPHFVWVDALAFDRIAHHPERIDRNSLQTALNRYRGHFLEGELAAWALTFRERLKSHFLKLSERLGSLLE